MKRFVGLLLLLIGIFMLGIATRRFLSTQSAVISPIPDTDTVRVIRVTPGLR